MKKFALLSVFDKTGIVDFARELVSLGYTIISTGGTAKLLAENNVSVTPIEEITKIPESFDGRIKTISAAIEGGILFDRDNLTHVKQAKKLGIEPIDIVVCNLYPFEQTIAKPNVTQEEALENIDVGGPTMVRAAAKNFEHVLVIIDPSDYGKVAEVLKTDNDATVFRQKLASKAFAHTSFYDSQIASFFSDKLFPYEITIPGRKVKELRYGENPHQKAALYAIPNSNSPILRLEKKWGRDLSLVNITDINAGLKSVGEFDTPCAVIIKHNNPCGIALGSTGEEALTRAIEADAESAFGGTIVMNMPVNEQTAKHIAAFKDERRGNIDIVAAPEIKQEALTLLQSVRKTMGIYTFGERRAKSEELKAMDVKWLDGGFVYQEADTDIEEGFAKWEVVTDKKPSAKQIEQMQIAWKFITHIRSNAVIVVDKDIPMTRGIGTGQTSRVRSVKIALEQAGKHAKEGILASDSFFPFGDSVTLAADYGIGAVVQQGDSINDKQSIDAANKAGIPMVFTHRRAFWH